MHSEARRVCFRTPALLGLDLLGFLAFEHFTTDIAWRVRSLSATGGDVLLSGWYPLSGGG